MNKQLITVVLLTLMSVAYTHAASNNSKNSTQNKTKETAVAPQAQNHNDKLVFNNQELSYESMIQNLTKDYYLLFFTSAGCGPCRQFKPNFHKFVNKYNFDYEIIDVADTSIPPSYYKLISQVRSVPTVMLVSKRKQQDSVIISYGNVSFDTLERIATRVSSYFQ